MTRTSVCVTGRRERAAQLGLSVARHDSYEANQSFPKVQRKMAKPELDTPDIKKTLDDFKGESFGQYGKEWAVLLTVLLNSLSFKRLP